MELVNPVPQDEAQRWLVALVTTLLGDPYGDDFRRRAERWTRDWLPERTWGYRDRDRWVATLATEPRTLTVPGPGASTREVAADALTGVTVAATHRRQGLLTAMIGASLDAAKERGDPVAILIAAEWPIYGRFGYAPAAFAADLTYHSKRPHAALPAPPAGSVRQVEPEELRKVAPEIFDSARRQRAGQVDRNALWWDKRLGQDGFEVVGKQPHWFLHEGDGGPDGLLGWRVDRDFTLTGNLGSLEVVEFVAANDTAYLDMWAYLGGIDVVDEVKLTDRPVDEPVRWLLPDGRALETRAVFDYLWLRLLDVPAALAGRSYAAPGRLVFDVVDTALGGYGTGRYALEADESGAARCAPTSEPADIALTQQTLAACYLGAHRFRQLAIAGIDELTPGALARADVMFSVPLAPVNQTGF